SLIFLALMLLLAWWGLPALDGFAKFAAWGGLLAVYVLFVIVETSGLILTLRRWRVNPGPNLEPNETRLRTALQRTVRQYRGRVYTSHWKMFGWPIIDCQVSDPQLSQPGDRQTRHRQPPRVARGWIAVGDEAVGLLLAIGGRARGFVAIGGRAVGVIALGGVAFGGLALGGCAAGALAFGGLCCGGVALGGVALGWQAVGGAACAWDTAVGGLAIARNAAAGGVAVAAELAYGGAAWARHGNDELARSALTNHPYLAGLAWYHLHLKSVTALVVILSVLPNFMMWGAMYRREPSANNHA
ncbi:MAG: hypothetical protein JSS02_19080, partial [Planctomycetes bacterium]|nr:hypothetical protein [Planctomycetota bacterium]